MEETAAAFAELGAAEIAVGLRAIATDTIRDDKLLSRVTMDVCLLLHLSERNYREFLQVVWENWFSGHSVRCLTTGGPEASELGRLYI